MTHHRKKMLQALKLARYGNITTSPNPMVGCIIENHGQIVGEGWHKFSGEDHAEIIALRQAGHLAKGATMYINLEPCNYFGLTPPCTHSIIKAAIKKVYVAIKDPNPLVAGKGLDLLTQAGIEIEVGLCSEEATKLNKIYLHYITQKRPYIICKWAMSLNGKITTGYGEEKWISCSKAREHTHNIRKSCDAILIGSNTALIDNPKLTYRNKEPIDRHPTRIILDTKGKLPLSLNIFDPALPGKTILVTTNLCNQNYLKSLTQNNIETLIAETNHLNQISLPNLLDQLGALKISSLLVEGGAEVHTSFINAGLANEALIYVTPKIINHPHALNFINNKFILESSIDFNFTSIKQIKNDLLLTAEFTNQ
ncbi:Riboflavin biosynthesis protein RibD [Rickettsiales bacterium Ac37b]|nr:Riboflavin biosynthesis protein RibD [Rickettsiales bacterium Ac37b]